MKKFLLITILFTLTATISNAQHLPKFSLYEINKQVINPASPAGDGLSLKAFHKNQWYGFNEAPKTSGIAVYQRLKKSSVGLYFMNDRAGIYNQNLLQINYSHDAKLSPEVTLNLGGSAGIDIYRMQFEELNLADLNDPKIYQDAQRAIIPDFNFGLFLHNFGDETTYVYSENKISLPQWYFGISFQHLVNLSLESEFLKHESYFPRHYFVLGGFRHKLFDEFQMEENFLIKYVKDVPFQADFGVKMFYQNKYNIGVSYRTANDLLFKLGFEHKNILFAYAYAYSLNKISYHNSHEISIGYSIRQLNFIPKY